MGRILEFDYKDALEAATRVFWKKGYTGTSLRDLLKSIGIGEGSFYNTLKSKKLAYLESLKHYNQTVNRLRSEAFFSAPTAALGVRGLFQVVLDCIDDPMTPSRVCLMAGSVTEEVLEDPDLKEYVQGQMFTLEARMIERMNAEKESGILGSEFDPQVVVPIIVTYLQGLWRMALVSFDRSQFERQIDLFLTSLGLRESG